jgi:hypothetical protein
MNLQELASDSKAAELYPCGPSRDQAPSAYLYNIRLSTLPKGMCGNRRN